MKNFSKKLSFVMATAMVVTSLYAPQGAEAATKNKIVEKNSKSAVKRKNIYIGGQVVDFDAVVKGKVVKDSKGTWKSSDSKIASVDKNGKVKARKNGRVTISFKTKATKKTKSVTVKMTIDARTRASKMTLTPSAVVVKEGEKSTVGVNYEISKKIQAAGGKATTYKLFVESSDEKVAKAYVEGNNKIVVEGVAKSATPVSITVYSAQVYKLENAKKVKYKLTEKFDVKVNSKLEAKQTGANKITVMGSDFVASKGAFVIKNSSGGVLPIKDEIKLNEAKTEAILEGTTTQIPAGKYTLTYNNGDTVEFEVVKAVVKRIEIVPSNTAIMVSTEKAIAYYKVYNQFDEDVTKNPLAANIKVSGSDGAGVNPAAKGEVVFTSTLGYQLNLSKVSVAVVDLESGVNVSALLTVGEQAKLWEVEYKGLFNNTTRKFVETIEDNDKLENFSVLYKAKDQYKNDFATDKALKPNAQLQVNALSITGVILAAPKLVTVGDEKYISYTLKNATTGTDTASRAGEVTLQAVVINNGKMASSKFNVVSSTKVDTLTIRAGALGVYENQDNWLDYTALDANGKEVTSWDKLKELNTTEFTRQHVKFVKKEDGKVGLLYTPGSVGATDSTSVTQVITYVTPTNKFGTATIAVRATRKPVTILGLASDQAKGVIVGRALKINANKIRFQDQYGNNMTAAEVAKLTGYKVKVSLTNPMKDANNIDQVFKLDSTVGTLDPSTGIPVFAAGKQTPAATTVNVTAADPVISLEAGADGNHTATAKVKLELINGTDRVPGSEDKTIELSYVLLKDLSSFKVEVPDLVPASNLTPVVADSDKGFEPSVYGYYAGEKIALEHTDFVAFGATDPSKKYLVPVQSIDVNKEGYTTKKDKGRIIINDDKPTTIDIDFTYGNAVRKVADSDFGATTMAVTGNTPQNWAALSASTALNITLKDQYDQANTSVPYITFSDFDNKEVTVANNGTNTATVALNNVGTQTVTMKLSFPGSTYTVEKTITINRAS